MVMDRDYMRIAAIAFGVAAIPYLSALKEAIKARARQIIKALRK